jgi:glucose-1-phosphate thymidylyltransferase
MIRADEVVCLVLCAGKGTRMRPLTYTRPKQLLPVCNQPVIDHIFDAIGEAGLRETCLVVDPECGALRRHVAEHPPDGLTVEWRVQQEPKGIADALLAARDFVADRPFIVYLGDAIYDAKIGGFVERFARDYPKGLIRLQPVADPRQYGVAILDGDGRVKAVCEKPREFVSDLAITGLYAFAAGFYSAIDRTRPSARGELEITDAISNFLPSGEGVQGETYTGVWADAGQPGVLLEANAALLEGRCPTVDPAATLCEAALEGPVEVGAGTRVERSRIVGPVLIGRDCILADATVLGPCVLNDGSRVEGSHVTNSLLDCGAAVQGLAGGLADSILGIGAQVTGASGAGQVTRLVAGDGARVALG